MAVLRCYDRAPQHNQTDGRVRLGSPVLTACASPEYVPTSTWPESASAPRSIRASPRKSRAAVCHQTLRLEWQATQQEHQGPQDSEQSWDDATLKGEDAARGGRGLSN